MKEKLLIMNKLPLPDEMIHEINEYLFISYRESHKKKMKAITKAIIEGAEFCDTCGKYLIRSVYSSRNGDERCCSIKCVNKYPGLFQCYTYLHEDYL